MLVTNLNPDSNVGASSWFVEMEGHRLLLDAGTHPEREGLDGLPLFDLIKDQEVESIALSHCHHDHVGSLPVATRHFPQAQVLMTELSYFIAPRVLHNSVNVMKRQRDELGIREYPLFTHDEVEDIEARFQGFKYNREVEWAAFKKTRAGFFSPTLEFFDAGHTLGSSGILVRGKKESLFYTGDVCFHDQTILRRARFEGVRAEVLLMETTRGNRQVPPGFSREKEIERLTLDLQRVLARRGSVLIPAFALGRTQEILALLALLMKRGTLKPQPVYIGGLGRVFSEIYDLESHRAHRQYPTLQLHEALNLLVMDPGQVTQMKLSPGRIFVITAGMMSEHTAAHDLAVRMMPDERHGIFFVGYSHPDTPGGRLRAAKKGEPFIMSGSAGQVSYNCEIQEYDLTAHANRDDLLDFVGQVEPREVLLTHGDADARKWFDENIRARYPRVKVHQPNSGQTVSV